jgi:hypothetical protein
MYSNRNIYQKSPTVYYPSIYRAGMVSAYGAASQERYERRYSRKKDAKLDRKLARFQKRLARLESKGTTGVFGRRRARVIERLKLKIAAIERIKGMDPFSMTIEDEAALQAQADMPENPPINIAILAVLGVAAAGGIYLVTKQKKSKK